MIAKMPRLVRGHEPVVDRQLVGEVATFGDLDRVDLADEVGDRGVGRRELLAVATVAVHPFDRRVVAALGDEMPRVGGRGRVRVVVDLAAGDDRHPLVEQVDELADDARLRLPALAEEDHVVPGEQRVRELREHGVLVTDDAFDERPLLGEGSHRVRADLFLDGTRLPAAGAQVSEGCGTAHAASIR